MAWLCLLITILCPPLGVPLGIINIYNHKPHLKIHALCMAIGVASFAFCYYPKGDPDIIRYWEIFETLKNKTFLQALSQDMHGDEGLYVFTALSWLFIQTGEINLFPAFSVFVVYYVAFYVTCQLGEDLAAKRSVIVLNLFFIMIALNYYAVVNNVRNIFAFSIIILAVFREMYQKKRDLLSLILYLAPVFIHPSAVIIILFRFAAMLTNKYKYLLFILASQIMLIVDFMHNLINRIRSGNIVVVIIRNMINKGYFYFHNTTSEWGQVVTNSLSYKVDRYLNVLFAILICIMYYICTSRKKARRKMMDVGYLVILEPNIDRLYLLQNFVFMLALTTIACLPMVMPEYWRFYSATVICCAPLYLVLANSPKQKERLMANSIFVSMPLGFLVSIRFLLYSHLGTLFGKPFISSPLIVLYRIIKSKL